MTDYTNTKNTVSPDSTDKKSAPRVNFKTLSAGDYITNEAYKSLRTNLFFCGSEIKTVLLTSCNENEGKSTVSAELSKSLAEAGKKTLMIDADMRKSVLLKSDSKIEAPAGLSEVLSNISDIEEAVCHTQIPNFDIIFAGHFPPNPVELIGNGKFEALLKQLKNFYDYIIIDSPPLGMVIDAAVIASCCDGAIMVIADGKVSRNAAKRVKEQLDKSGCRILGAVINQSEKNSRLHKKYYYGSKEYR